MGSSCFAPSTYDPKIVVLHFLSLLGFTGAFEYHKLLNIIIFSQPLFSIELQCSEQLRDFVIHLEQCNGE